MQLSFQKNLLYSLKHRFGKTIYLYKRGTPSTNLDSGVTTVTWTPYKCRKVIVLPSDWKRKFEYDLSYLAATHNKTYGDLFDTSLQWIIIDKRDIPNTVVFTQDDEVSIDGKTLSIKQIMDYTYGLVMLLKEIGNESQLPRHISGTAETTIAVISTGSHE